MGTGLTEEQLIYDWSSQGGDDPPSPRLAMLDDETLRDGLQSPSVIDPPLGIKIKILHLMDSLGIETADIGLPGSGPRQREAVERLCREIADNKLRIQANCAARTMVVDIQPIADVTQKTGVPIEACVFIGSSPIRQYAEEWDIDHILRLSREAVAFAVGEGLDVMYVTEDTIRANPKDLRVLLTAAVDAGAKRLCLCDTVGAAVPQGVRNLVTWVKQLTAELGVADRVGIDWHGHRDRGLDVANTLAALEAGATRVHGTALGVGERVGNTPMEQLLVNLRLLGWRNDDLTALPDYVDTVSKAVGVPIPVNTPIVGRDAFRTATGVHAAAVIKAQRKGAAWLADRVYSGVPASWVGRGQEIEIGHMSGASNVIFYLQSRGLATNQHVVQAVLAVAKKSERLLTKEEILEAVESVTAKP
ncbi:MAG: LeuA family protein [Gemmatimonadota bacterium]|nr:LeuA family protein [Gemmatimonadota bacterium]MDH3368309.1 LeuA family protein [Gemmatimonadota bacterium]MDH3478779.1 LeuA family protein [Gemmatimonadota bacterium]MDH3568842.1 LeuA family protein [Gemmatimonadota bacterium]